MTGFDTKWGLFRIGATIACILFLGRPGAVFATDDPDSLWTSALRQAYFGERTVVESEQIIELDAPARAEDGAVVPVTINAKIPQTAQRYIKTLTLLIDKNPAPLAGRFHFTPRSGRADLSLRIRINEYSPVRVVAETNDGQLYMSRRFVKASGGCSAPIGTDLDRAMARLGKMRFRTKAATSLKEPWAAQLAISHPNVTGLQMDQLTRLYAPAHFVNKVAVSFDGDLIFSAETDISISENPNFRFYFVPSQEGVLTAEVFDTKGVKFTEAYPIRTP